MRAVAQDGGGKVFTAAASELQSSNFIREISPTQLRRPRLKSQLTWNLDRSLSGFSGDQVSPVFVDTQATSSTVRHSRSHYPTHRCICFFLDFCCVFQAAEDRWTLWIASALAGLAATTYQNKSIRRCPCESARNKNLNIQISTGDSALSLSHLRPLCKVCALCQVGEPHFPEVRHNQAS